MKISQQKRNKIYEQILALLYSKSPQSIFTAEIAREIARDEEFIKNLLQEMNKLQLVISIKQNPKGVQYKRRTRWRISNKAYKAYNQQQELISSNYTTNN